MAAACCLALLAALLATLVAVAGGGRAPRAVLEAAPSGAGTEEAPLEPGSLEVPAWRELWYGSLEALHREPVINNTQEEVLAQLGAVAYLHCPVRHLGERGVSVLIPSRSGATERRTSHIYFVSTRNRSIPAL